MSYIQSDLIKEFLDKLCAIKGEAREEKLSSLNELDLKGDKVEYNIILLYIKAMGADQRDVLHENANAYKKINGVQENKLRVIDYILLEIPRANDYEGLKSQITSSKELLREVKNNNRENQQVMQEHEEKMSKMQGEFISILSIFSAVIIAFFGGISILGSCLENINKANSYKLFFMVLLIGFIMFNVIYMLLYSISRLTGKKIGTKIEVPACKNCECPYFIKCLFVKYPIVFLYNAITLMLCITIYIMYLVDYYNVISAIVNLYSKSKECKFLVPVIGMIFFTIISFILYEFVFKKFLNSSILNCNYNKNKDKQ